MLGAWSRRTSRTGSRSGYGAVGPRSRRALQDDVPLERGTVGTAAALGGSERFLHAVAAQVAPAQETAERAAGLDDRAAAVHAANSAVHLSDGRPALGRSRGGALCARPQMRWGRVQRLPEHHVVHREV